MSLVGQVPDPFQNPEAKRFEPEEEGRLYEGLKYLSLAYAIFNPLQ
jgi:hypothetical protein